MEKESSSNVLASKNLHVHFPSGSVSKDGPSAGITVVVALASLFTGRSMRDDTAMTGEVTLSGQVLPVYRFKLIYNTVYLIRFRYSRGTVCNVLFNINSSSLLYRWKTVLGEVTVGSCSSAPNKKLRWHFFEISPLIKSKRIWKRYIFKIIFSEITTRCTLEKLLSS